MTSETLLVTGATGFVGSHLVEACRREGVPVRALVRRSPDRIRLEEAGVACVRGSLEDPSALAEAVRGVGAVLHLAAALRARSPGEYERANAAGTRAVVEAALAARPRPRRLVYLSSLAAAGPSVGGRPVTPQDEPRPLTAYGRTKLAGEKTCAAVAAGLEVVILRAPAVYGPRDRDVFHFFKLANRGIIPLPAGPPRPLQMIHATDLARALLLAATHEGARGLYHVAEPRPYTWEEVALLIAGALGRRARVVRVPPSLVRGAAAASETLLGLWGRSTIFNRDKARELLAPGWTCETELARRDFGFQAEIPLPAGLRQTAEWYRAHGWI